MHDVIIIGAGPAGLSAAYWCDELGLDTLVLEQSEQVGGQLHQIHNPIHNYLGVEAKNGRELLELFSKNDDADFDLWTQTEIESINLKSRQVSLRSGEQLQSIAIIIATGVRRRRLGLPGELEFVGKGIIESGAREQDLWANQDVCIVGGGDAAVENALLLADKCATVTVVHRGKKLSARSDFAQRLQSNHCVTVFTDSVLTRIIGSESIEGVEIKRREGLKPFQVAVRGLLIRIGAEPNSELVRDQLKVDERGYIEVDSVYETTMPMVFAIGDISNPIAPTISGATGAGATAAKTISARLNVRP
jgi:thioredoxin reductase (NADPH)